MAILKGINKFALEWAEGTPFDKYTIPAFISFVVSGVSPHPATINLFAKRKTSFNVSITAVYTMMEYIKGQKQIK